MDGLEQYVARRPWLTDAVIVLAVLVGAIVGVNLSDPDGARRATCGSPTCSPWPHAWCCSALVGVRGSPLQLRPPAWSP